MERAVLLVASLFLFAHTMPRAWRTLNTDFPNYYLAATLVHEGYDTSRMYEWQWIEREKDHRAIDDRVIGLLPITPFSTLVVYPLTVFTPLVAKHIWILINLAWLIPIVWMLRALTGLSLQRIALLTLLSFPLHRNLLFGQFYVLLLLLIVAACFFYRKGHSAFAGGLLAVAAACKVFPLLFFVFFLQRRDWRALTAGLLTGILALAASIGAFGWNAHRTWLQEILPWVMRGEGLGTYTVTPSIAGILHVLLLSEPQWNPHPWHESVLLYALLAPTLPMLILAPAILLIRKQENSTAQTLLEWSALLTASLAISTIPASYNFVLMIFPVSVLSALLVKRRQYAWLLAVVMVYLGIGFPLPVPSYAAGLSLLLYVPRLPLMLALLSGIYVIMWRNVQQDTERDWSRYAWAAVILVAALSGVWSTLQVQQAERQEYAYRLPLREQGFLNAGPESTSQGVSYAAFTLDGYQVLNEQQRGVQASPGGRDVTDDLSFTSRTGRTLIERAGATGSMIIDASDPSHSMVNAASDPMLSLDGSELAFLRAEHGQGRLLFRSNAESSPREIELSPSQLNVYEASFHSNKEYAFAASDADGSPRVYLTDAAHTNVAVLPAQSRYPAISFDGRWMVYSQLTRGVWNLWLRDQQSGATRRVADVPCNQVQPSWEEDSKTILYGTDCGRSLWFTAIARRRVLP